MTATVDAPARFESSSVVMEIRKLVNEFGEDHTAEGLYVKDGEPECIVGHVVARLTPDVKLPEHTGILGLAGRLEAAGYTRSAIVVLHAAQDAQDKPQTWGHSLTAAMAAYQALHAIESLSDIG